MTIKRYDTAKDLALKVRPLSACLRFLCEADWLKCSNG